METYKCIICGKEHKYNKNVGIIDHGYITKKIKGSKLKKYVMVDKITCIKCYNKQRGKKNGI